MVHACTLDDAQSQFDVQKGTHDQGYTDHNADVRRSDRVPSAISKSARKANNKCNLRHCLRTDLTFKGQRRHIQF